MNALSSIIMSESRLTNSFKSYIGFDDDSLNASSEDFLGEQLAPRLLRGETIIAEAQKVLMFVQVSERKKGKSGSLYVTNFKLSFTTTNDSSSKSSGFLDHLYLGPNDICLSNVDSIYLISDKKRKLLPGKNLSEKVNGLYVVCKNMKTLKFSFKFSPVGHGKTLTTALLHHAFPKRHQLLFAYDFMMGGEVQPQSSETRLFREAGDWGKELARTQASGWKLTSANLDFQMSRSLPKYVVVPESVIDWQLVEAARYFRSGRPPLWCWSHSNGAALVKMADISPSVTDRVQENIMLENVRKSHPKLLQPQVEELVKDLPSIKEISQSFSKLRDICSPEDIKQYSNQDNNFYLLLDSTKWLYYVSLCLERSYEVTKKLNAGYTVVLQENDGRDTCCIISSLSQILIDPFYRTISGFQSLIQKEWVVSGHPFSTRLGLVYTDPPQNQSPVFLLFLDCVWQITQQFPTAFQFTETYLTALWESVFISVYDTFLFDCEMDRLLAITVPPGNALKLRSVWDDNLGFLNESAVLWNPFFSTQLFKSVVPLEIKPSIFNLELWQQCYFRHIELLEISGGGNIQIEMMGRMLNAAVQEGGLLAEEIFSEGFESLNNIGSFFPFSTTDNSDIMSSSSLSSSLLISSLSLNNSFHSTISSPD